MRSFAFEPKRSGRVIFSLRRFWIRVKRLRWNSCEAMFYSTIQTGLRHCPDADVVTILCDIDDLKRLKSFMPVRLQVFLRVLFCSQVIAIQAAKPPRSKAEVKLARGSHVAKAAIEGPRLLPASRTHFVISCFLRLVFM